MTETYNYFNDAARYAILNIYEGHSNGNQVLKGHLKVSEKAFQ